jgi:hypothetical protein
MYVSIGKSTRAGKKMMAIFYDEAKKKIKTTHFGASGYEDYTTHGEIQRKMNYIARHKEREDWTDYMSSGSLARFILWNKPTIKASIEDYMSRFRLRAY